MTAEDEAPPLESVVVEPAVPAQASVIWLHGLGADGHDFEPAVGELGLPADLPVRFVFPHAPEQPVTVNGGMAMRAWYDVLDMELAREDEPGIRASERRVTALVAAEAARGVPAGRVVLAGFSQGGAIALHTALRYPEPLAGVVALSTYLPLAPTARAERNPANTELPVFMAHGTEDGVIPVDRGRRSRDELEALGHAVAWHEYPMPHAVCVEELRAIGSWLRERLGGAE